MSIQTAIELAGGPAALAAAIGASSSQQVNNWRIRGRVPAEFCRAIEGATQGQVTRYELRPDVFGETPDASN